ncbi:MAG: SsrA-binding protein SmpB [Bacteroidetes bacterium]|nr:MAG: SsrA-binding protein SmpB [Bacteroidota bacterium]
MKTEGTRERTKKIVAKNRKAYHDFEVIQTFEAGIALQGTEVKSIRQGKISLQEAYASFKSVESFELYLLNFHISPYDFGNIANHEPKRPRKLLLTQRELKKIKVAVQEKGLTLIPLGIYFSGPYVKIEIGLVRAKRKYDKREAVKERESEREIRKKFRV